MTDISQQHGAFSWCELMTTDTTAAIEFYSQLFGWKVEARPMLGMTYNMLSVGNSASGGLRQQAVGGLMSMPPNIPSTVPPRWGVYVTVDDVDAAAKLVEELGGKVMQPPIDIDESMRFSLIQDPQGAMLSIISYRNTAA
jgi:uncharacterized protein